MKFWWSKIILSFILLGISFDGFAKTSIWIEPLLSKRFRGSITLVSMEEERKGAMYGGRFGIRNLISGTVWGIDLRKGGFEFRSERGNITKMEANYLGFFVSFIKSPLFKFWGSYFFKYNDKYVERNEILKGTGLNFGVGYALLSFVNITFEFSRFLLNKMEYADGRTVPLTSLSNGFHEYTGSEFLLGISVPFDFSF